MTSPSTSPALRRAWLLLALLAFAGGWYAWRTFPAAFPLLDLDVRMSRHAALAAADSIATTLSLGPDGGRGVAVFQGEYEAQTYIELEGAGPEGFRALIRSGDYHAWQWQVRRFRPGSSHELRVFFAPDGAPVGFREQIPEEEPGPALAPDSARTIALTHARAAWDVAIGADWEELPAAVETRPSGRLDHTFVWEQTHPALGDARFRLRLTVTGDRLSEIHRFIHVPEAFTRRYREIRSANDGLAIAANVGMLVLYGFGGVIIGLVLLARRQPLYSRAAIRWAAGLAAIVTLSAINYLPFAWLDYDTALPTSLFLTQQVGLIVAGVVGLTLLFAASFLGGENLARAGFADHPFLWSAFGRDAGGSTGMAQRVALGLLLTPLFLAYAVGFSAWSSRWNGWWSPLTPLIEPNLIASPFPWLEIVAGPLQAAVWEELVFRAIPFGAAVLLAQRFGGRRGWLSAAFVVQAVIFAAAHANYPAQPSYARLVELLLPSCLFGALFLRWGLIPAIVLHFEYDLVLFALPLFATPAGMLLGSKAIVVLAALAPLALVLYRRGRAGAWIPLPAALRNAAHRRAEFETPGPAPTATAEAEAEQHFAAGPPALPVFRGLAAVAGGGITLWLVGLALNTPSTPRLEVGRSTAVAAALDTLARLGADTTAGWMVSARTMGGITDAHRFVLQTAGRATHDSLLGRYLPAPRWEVALRRHDGDVAERAEEWGVMLAGDGTVRRVTHRLPEHRPGAMLDQSEARALADSAVRAAYGLDPERLELVGAVPTERPARRDWVFTFADPNGPDLGAGQLRIEIGLAGDAVIRTGRSVHLPEQWQRERRRSAVGRLLPGLLAAAAIGGLWIAGAVAGLIRWSRGTLARRRTVAVGLAMTLLSLGAAWNSWPAAHFGFTTTAPLALQQTIAMTGAVLVALMAGAIAGLLTGLPLTAPAASNQWRWLPGVSIGAAIIGLRAVIGFLGQSGRPATGTASPLDHAVPLLAPALDAIGGLLMTTAVLTAATWTLAGTHRSHGIRRALGGFLTIGLAVVASGAGGVDSPLLAAGGVVAGVIVVGWAVRRVLPMSRAAIPVAAATIGATAALSDLMTNRWAGSQVGALLALAALGALTPWLVRLFEQESADSAG